MCADIGGMLSQLASVTQQATEEQDVLKALERHKLQFMIKYRRPSDEEMTGVPSIRLLNAFWRDDLAGQTKLPHALQNL